MEIYNFLLGLLVWAGVGCVIALITYTIAYCASKIWGFKIRKPLSSFLLIIFGCELSYILQTAAREFGFAFIFQRYQTLFILVNTLFIIGFIYFLSKKNHKKGS